MNIELNIEKTIPEVIKTYRIDNIKIMLENSKAMVEIWVDNICDRKEVDISAILELMSKEDMLIIKDFLNQIMALSLDIEEIDIPDTLFKIKEVVIEEDKK